MKKHQSAFFLVFVTYIIVGIAAILLFHQNGSRLSHQLEANAAIEKESSSQSASMKDTDPVSDDIAVVEYVETPDTTANDVESAPETNETVVTEPIETDEAAVPEPENTGEAVSTEPVDTDLSADHSDASSENDTTDELSENDDTDERSETDTTDTEPEKIYYGFTVKSGRTNVRVRKSSERNSSIVAHVNGDDTGYLIEEGKNRSKIVLADGTIGYIYNEYITVSEIPKEDVPEEYR
ncbi:MAG: hypothetical protein SPG09_12470 [Lachnospiraceae bacterium]|nr:hypothetical protein [bacterium]MDY5518402.1 hypothetical protein [Lachnospiraceae bacterium]